MNSVHNVCDSMYDMIYILYMYIEFFLEILSNCINKDLNMTQVDRKIIYDLY